MLKDILVTSETGRAAAIKALNFARENNVKTAFTFSDPSMPTYFKDGLMEILGAEKIDILFCNREELEVFTGEPDLSKGLEAASQFAHQVVMTNGSEGAIFYRSGEKVFGVAPKVNPVDTIGAGDLFAERLCTVSLKGLILKNA